MTNENGVAAPEAAMSAADHLLGDPQANLTLLGTG